MIISVPIDIKLHTNSLLEIIEIYDLDIVWLFKHDIKKLVYNFTY